MPQRSVSNDVDPPLDASLQYVHPGQPDNSPFAGCLRLRCPARMLCRNTLPREQHGTQRYVRFLSDALVAFGSGHTVICDAARGLKKKENRQLPCTSDTGPGGAADDGHSGTAGVHTSTPPARPPPTWSPISPHRRSRRTCASSGQPACTARRMGGYAGIRLGGRVGALMTDPGAKWVRGVILRDRGKVERRLLSAVPRALHPVRRNHHPAVRAR